MVEYVNKEGMAVTNGGSMSSHDEFYNNTLEELERLSAVVDTLDNKTTRIQRHDPQTKEGQPESIGYDEFSEVTGNMARIKDKIMQISQRIDYIISNIDV